ncbi:MAG TPA: ADP-ribosylation factor-like protein [Dokdonella sp.]|uniref:GTP-binding protein n=1 Tax=Dokdonella sp. TaxID=2291710 RepID=UPI002D80447A|nr:ADP-ribosylation factor-like protein [Dokdonella sp.]HET9033573.1 ADP-ribosylation factor-like protein [Dokdonella sp.]
MATIDPASNTVVIRVVYDGPALAGKTTSVRSLAQGLGGQVVIPEEADGRTVFFDWLDYTGGLFEGRAIRCQIISVPGQATLAGRRRHLLESADVVVFVADSTRDAQDTVRRYLESLQRMLAASAGPPVGIVLQANKRDHADATPLVDMQQMLDAHDLKVGIVESIATEGTGIRQAFVFAVRLALDRVRELIRLERLPIARPDVDSADELLDSLRKSEGGVLRALPEGGLVHTRLSDVRSASAESLDAELRKTIRQIEHPRISEIPTPDSKANESPALPNDELPSGMIWPPVEGRMTLHEIMQTPQSIICTARGNWLGNSSKAWKIHSPAEGRFDTLELGRQALLSWARVHVSGARIISSNRCVALAADGHGGYRLWQFVRKQSTLLDAFRKTLLAGPDSTAQYLVELQDIYARALELWPNVGCRVPLGIATMAASAQGPSYVGTMPFPFDSSETGMRRLLPTLEWMLRELDFASVSLRRISTEALAAGETLASTQPRYQPHFEIVRGLFARLESNQSSNRRRLHGGQGS